MKRGYRKIESDSRHLRITWFDGLDVELCGKYWMYELRSCRGIGVSIINSKVLHEIIGYFGMFMIDCYRWHRN